MPTRSASCPQRATWFAIYQTHPEEAAGYVAEFVHPLTIGALLTLPVALAVLLAMARSPRPRLPRRARPLALGLAGVVLWQTGGTSNEVRLVSSLAAYGQMLAAYRDVAARRSTSWREIAAQRTRRGPELMVVVIGESTSRNHMGLYGYFRDTTPRLSALAGDLVVLTDAISSHSHTIHVLPQVLTLADVDNGLDYTDPQAYSIVEILKAAGVETWWLSNQKRMGVWDDQVAVLAQAADHVEFVTRRLGRNAAPGFDARLLPAFREAVRAPGEAKVIFVHLIGTHWPYDQRYPKRFARFAGPLGPSLTGDLRLPDELVAKVDSYDNAVLYQDHVLGELIDILSREGPPASSLLYVSDHGESPLEGTGHDAARFGRGHVEIPLLLWFSDTFEERHPDLVRRLRSNRDQPFMTDELEDVVLDLAGIASPDLEPTRSPLRADFALPRRLTLAGELDYDAHPDPFLEAKRNLAALRNQRPDLHEKTWAHRVNSLGKLGEAIGIFAGVELDLVFDAERGRLEVRHPPVASSGLWLEDVLAYLQRQTAQPRLWLDLKDIDLRNVGPVALRLLELDRTFGLKHRAIVETSFTGPGLERLADAGFYLSYYLPSRPIRRALKAQRAEELRELAARIASVVERHGARAVSFEFGLEPFVRDHLGELVERRGLDLLTWDLTLDSARRPLRRARPAPRLGPAPRGDPGLVPLALRSLIRAPPSPRRRRRRLAQTEPAG